MGDLWRSEVKTVHVVKVLIVIVGNATGAIVDSNRRCPRYRR